MKKIWLIVVLLITSLFQLFAINDNFSFLKYNQYYSALMNTVKNNGSSDVLFSAIKELEKNKDNSEEDMIAYIRGNVTVADFIRETDKKKAKEYLDIAKKDFNNLDYSVDPKIILVLDFCIKSISYSISPLANIKDGIASSKIIDDAFENYPDNPQIRILYAAKLLFAPKMAGGNKTEALNTFSPLSAETSLADWDRFDILAGIGTALSDLGKENDAKRFIDAAKTIYPNSDL